MDQIILILLDESLSMRSKKTDVVNGINQFLDVQRDINPDSRLILIKFNNNVTIMHKGVDLSMVESLRMCDYNPCGRTALFDAICTGFKLADELRGSGSSSSRVSCIIMTDGEDNASKEHQSCKTIQKLVNKYEMKTDWSFTYLGKSSDCWSRTKPVSKISYDSRPQYFVNETSAVAMYRRLRALQLQSVPT